MVTTVKRPWDSQEITYSDTVMKYHNHVWQKNSKNPNLLDHMLAQNAQHYEDEV